MEHERHGMVQSDNTTPYKASEYDRNVRRTIPFYETMHRETIDLVRTVRADVTCWLDTGCGTGHLIELALSAFPGAHFLAADPSPAMLEEARKRLRDVPEGRVTFLPPASSEGLSSCGDVTAPQVITAILCHHYLQAQQRQEATVSCFRMLDTGGLFVTFENVLPRSTEGSDIGFARWKRWQMEQGRSPAEVEEHLKRFNKQYFPIPVAEHVRLLKSVGFRVAEVFWVSQMQAGLYALK